MRPHSTGIALVVPVLCFAIVAASDDASEQIKIDGPTAQEQAPRQLLGLTLPEGLTVPIIAAGFGAFFAGIIAVLAIRCCRRPLDDEELERRARKAATRIDECVVNNESVDNEEVGSPSKLGIVWGGPSGLTVERILSGTPAARDGVTAFAGRRVQRVNGVSVANSSEVEQQMKGASRICLRFESEGGLTDSQANNSSLSSYPKGTPVLGTTGRPSPASSFGAGGLDTAPSISILAQWCKPESVSAVSGVYRELEALQANGQKVWEHIETSHWLFSSTSGHWCVTCCEHDLRWNTTTAVVLRSKTPHNGASPDRVKKWVTEAGKTADVFVTINNESETLGGFAIGTEVTCAEDIMQRNTCVVKLGTRGIVKGVDRGGLKVRFFNLDRDTILLPDEVDRASGPPVQILSPGKVWRNCIIINETASHMKVHYIGYDRAWDEWIEKNSPRVRH